MPDRSRWLSALALVVLIALLIAWPRGSEKSPTTGPGAARSPDARAQYASESAGSVVPAPPGAVGGSSSSASVAFPDGTPLIDMHAVLREQAEAGNTEAGCRLGMELGRCGAVLEQRRSLDRDIAAAARLAPGSVQEQDAMRRIAADTADLAPLEAMCRGITGEQAHGAWQPLLRAARAGHLPSMEAFAILPPLSETNFTADLDGWMAYRRNALPLLLAAAGRGSPRAHNQLAWIYGHLPVAGGSPLAPRNLVRAIAHASVARDAATPTSRRQLDRLVAKWQREAGADAARRAASIAADLRASLAMPAGGGIDFTNDQVRHAEDCH
jgi:hypothetical protein